VSKHGKGKAKSIIAHKFAVAIYYMLKNGKAFDEKQFISHGFVVSSAEQLGEAVNPAHNWQGNVRTKSPALSP